MEKRTALLLGASGLVGSFCLDYLLAEESYEKVIILVRRDLQKTHPKLEQHIIDFSQLGTYRSLIKADDIYSCLGTTVLKSPKKTDYLQIDFTYPYSIAMIAKENGAKQFSFVSALSANPKAWFFYSRVKGQLEMAMMSIGFASVQILRPSYLVGERKEFRLIERIGVPLLKLFRPLFLGKMRKFRPIAAKAVAFAMVKTSVQHKLGVHIWFGDEMQRIYDKS